MIAERLARAGGPTKPIKLVRDIRGDSLQGVADAGQDLVLVTEDLVRRLDDNELAYVLGHELAHFEHEDSARMTGYVRKVVEDLGTNAEALDERLKKKGRGFVVRTLAQIGHGAAGIAAGYVMVHSKSREHEQGADTRAVDLMTAAGFDPQAATRALRKLHGGSVPDVGILRTLRSTHPNPASRVAAVARQAEAAKKRNRKQG
jgi:Zn-dependent protease with chaperone function